MIGVAHWRRALKDPAGSAGRPRGRKTERRAFSPWFRPSGRPRGSAGAFTLRLGSVLPLAALLQAGPQHGPPPSDAVAQSAIAELRSPYCPGLMLEVCPSPQAELLRDSIRDLAASGKSKNEIVTWMLGRHGEEWRAVPRRSGVGLWAWIVPPLALLAASVWLARRGWSLRRSAPPPVEPGELSAADRARLEAELRELERIG